MTSHGAPENDDCYGASARQKSSSSARSGPLMTSGNPVFWSKTPAFRMTLPTVRFADIRARDRGDNEPWSRGAGEGARDRPGAGGR